MPLGFVPASGDWKIRQFTSSSTATFIKGCLVALDENRRVVEYVSTYSAYLGVALADSANSTPAGQVQIAIPTPGCTAFTDVAPGVTQASLATGSWAGIGKRGNYMSFVTTHMASLWSQPVHMVGHIRSSDSRVEVGFNALPATFWSTSSATLS